jgi:hypothetical protein
MSRDVVDAPVRWRVVGAGAIAYVAAIALTWSSIFFGETNPEQTADHLPLAIFLGVVTAAIFGLAVPRGLRPGTRNRPARAGAFTGAVAVLTVAVFWSGLPVVLGAAALVLGAEGWRRVAGGAGRRIEAALALGLGGVGGGGGVTRGGGARQRRGGGGWGS